MKPEYDEHPSPADQPPHDDTVENLLLRAGRRPPVPEDDAAIVKAAARAQWQWAVRGEKRRRRTRVVGGLLAAAAVLLLAVGVGVWRFPAPSPAGPVAMLETVSGELWALEDPTDPAAEATRLEVGAELPAGATLETRRGEASRAVLRLADGASVRLDTATRLNLLSANELELTNGAVYLDSGSQGEALEVHTPLGIARDVGTRFEVRLDGGEAPLLVRVREGLVLLESGGEEHEARAGVELAVAGDGEVTLSEMPLHGEIWDWTLAILPAFDAEGRSLHEFLTWAARESGVELRYAESDLVEKTRGVTLHGSIAGLALEDATTVALMSSGLDLGYRFQDGLLVVEPSGQK